MGPAWFSWERLSWERISCVVRPHSHARPHSAHVVVCKENNVNRCQTRFTKASITASSSKWSSGVLDKQEVVKQEVDNMNRLTIMTGTREHHYARV